MGKRAGKDDGRVTGKRKEVNEVRNGGFKARLCDIKLPEWGVTKEVGEGCTLVDWAATSNVPWTHVLVATLWLEARWALQPLTSEHKLSPPLPSSPLPSPPPPSPPLRWFPSSASPSSISETHSRRGWLSRVGCQCFIWIDACDCHTIGLKTNRIYLGEESTDCVEFIRCILELIHRTAECRCLYFYK